MFGDPPSSLKPAAFGNDENILCAMAPEQQLLRERLQVLFPKSRLVPIVAVVASAV